MEAFVFKLLAEQSPSVTGHTGLRRAGILPKTLSWRLVLRAAATGMDTLKGKGAQDVPEGAQWTGPQGSTGLADGRCMEHSSSLLQAPLSFLRHTCSAVCCQTLACLSASGDSGQGVFLRADDENSACPLIPGK